MTQRIKDRLLNAAISFITATTAVVLGFSLSSSEAKSLRINQELDDRPKFEYVDSQDEALQDNINDLKIEVNDDMDRVIDNMNQRFDEQKHSLDIMVELLKE